MLSGAYVVDRKHHALMMLSLLMRIRSMNSDVGATSKRLEWRRVASPGVAVWALAVLAVIAVASVEYLPTNDGPRHVFAVHAANHLDDPATGWSSYFDSVVPVTNLGFGLLFGSLDRLLPWRTALRVSLGFMVVIWIGGAWWFVRSLHPGRAWLGVALGAAATQWTLYMGFFSFYLSSAFGLWVLGLALRWSRQNRKGSVALAALLFLQALFHTVAAAMTGLVVAAIAVGCSQRGETSFCWTRARSALLSVVAMGTPAAVVAAFVFVFAVTGSGDQGDVEIVGAPLWTLGRCFLAGPAWRAWPLTALAVAALPLGMLARRAEDRALCVIGALLFVCAIFVPLHIPAWEFVSVRFLPLAVCVLVATLPVERLIVGRLGRIIPATCLGFALACTGWAFDYNRSLATRSADALSGLDAPIERDGPRLPIILDPALGSPPGPATPMPYAAPLANLGHLYAVAQGGVLPYNFAVDATRFQLQLHADAHLRYPPVPDDLYKWAHWVESPATESAQRAAVLTRASVYGAFYQDVILWGRAEDANLLVHRGYVLDWQRGGFAVAHFEGCPFTITLEDSTQVPDDLVLELGWYPLDKAVGRTPVRAIERVGRLEIPVDRAPCGAVWLRFSHRISRESIPCAGSDAEGRLIVASTRATPSVDCRPAQLAGGIAPDASR